MRTTPRYTGPDLCLSGSNQESRPSAAHTVPIDTTIAQLESLRPRARNSMMLEMASMSWAHRWPSTIWVFVVAPSLRPSIRQPTRDEAVRKARGLPITGNLSPLAPSRSDGRCQEAGHRQGPSIDRYFSFSSWDKGFASATRPVVGFEAKPRLRCRSNATASE